jgi:hypothetical protein
MKGIYIAGLVTMGVALLVLLAYVVKQNTRPVGVEYTRGSSSGSTRFSTKPSEYRYVLPTNSDSPAHIPLENRRGEKRRRVGDA